MYQTAAPIIEKMKTVILGIAISLFIITAGFTSFGFFILSDYRLPIPLPVNTAIYSLLVLALLYAVFQVIKIYRNIPDNIETTLKRSLKEMNITYIIIFASSVYACITIGINLYFMFKGSIIETEDTYYGLDALVGILGIFFEMVIVLLLCASIIPHIIAFSVNLVINIIIAAKFDTYYNTKQHKRIKDWFTFISAARLFIGVISICTFVSAKIQLIMVPLILLSLGFTLYSIFVLFLIRFYGKLIDIQTYPVISVSDNINDTEVIGYEDFAQYSNNYYDINS